MKASIYQRLMAAALSLALLCGIGLPPALAAEGGAAVTSTVCPHHEHNADCGYAEGKPCTHVHTADCETTVTNCVHEHTAECYPAAVGDKVSTRAVEPICGHICDEASLCVTKSMDCPHVKSEHNADCGYAEGKPCTFDPAECLTCNPKDSSEAAPVIVTGFAALDESVQQQAVAAGTELAGLNLPDTLSATGNTTEDSVAAADLTIEDVAWELNPANEINDGNTTYDPTQGSYAFTPVLPEGYTVAENVSLPEIWVMIGEAQTLADNYNIFYNNIVINQTNRAEFDGRTISGSTTSNTITIDGVTVTLVISGLSIQLSGNSTYGIPPIDLQNGASLTLKLSGASTLTAGSGAAGICVPAGCALTIEEASSGGSLSVKGAASGIGTNQSFMGTLNNGFACGTIIINSGTVTAQGGGHAAGIGNSGESYSGIIEINGGTVTATGGSSNDPASAGAGIGGGTFGGPERVTITGGVVTATGGSGLYAGTAPGIGGGGVYSMGDGINLPCGIISITGGTVNAKPSGKNYAIGIGRYTWADKPGLGEIDGSVTIGTAAKVNTYGAEIYPTPSGVSCYDIDATIHDGRIKATTSSATVTIGGIAVPATLEKTGDYTGNIKTRVYAPPSQTKVTITSDGSTWEHTAIAAGANTFTIGKPLVPVNVWFYDSAITGDITVSTVAVTQSGTTLGNGALFNPGKITKIVEGTGRMLLWMPEGANTSISVTATGLNGGTAMTKTALTITRDMEVTLFEAAGSAGMIFDISKGNITFKGGANGTLTVTCFDDEGAKKTVENLSYSTEYTIFGSSTSGTIAVKDTTSLLNIKLKNVNITTALSPIRLTDGAKVFLKLEGANTLTETSKSLTNGGIGVPTGCELTIDGTGSVTATGGGYAAGIGGGLDESSGKITILGGTIVANGGSGGAGIGGGGTGDVNTVQGTVIISGGDITATGGSSGRPCGAGIGGGGTMNGNADRGNGTVTITGGTVTATGGAKGDEPAAGIGGGNNSTGTVTITGGTVTATGGRTADVTAADIGGGYKSTGTGTVTITGGTIHNGKGAHPSINGTLTNGSSATVYPVVANVKIPCGVNNVISATNSNGYNSSSIKTDASGKVYFYLPGSTNASFTFSGRAYTGTVGTGTTTLLTKPKIIAEPRLSGDYGKTVAEMTLDQGQMETGVSGSWTLTAASTSDKPDVNGSKTYQLTYTTTTEGFANLTLDVVPVVSPIKPTVTFTSATESKPYTGSPVTVTKPKVNGVDFAGTITYSYQAVGSDNVVQGLPTNAGSYVVTAHLGQGGNYLAADSTNTLTLTIQKSNPTLTVNGIGTSSGKVYDGTAIAAPTAVQVAVSGAVYSDIAFTYYADNSGAKGNKLDSAPTNAGTYHVQGDISITDNTNAATNSFKFTITKAPLTITGGTVTPRKWDGSTSATVTALTFGGLQSTETLTLGTDYTVTSAAYADANVMDSKTVTAGTAALSATEKANNYSLSDGALSGKGITGNITKADSPAAPTFSAMNDDKGTDNFTFVPTAGHTTVTDYEWKLESDPTWTPVSTNPIVVGNKAGKIQIRVKGTANYNEGGTYTHGTAFTASLEGNVSITGTAAYGETLSAAASGTQSGTLTYTWKADGVTNALQAGTSDTLIIPGVAVGKTITVEVTATGYSGKLTSAATGAVAKKAVTAAVGTISKVYDGTNTVETVDQVLSIAKVNEGDAITITAPNATYSDKTVANDKAITLGNLTITGAEKDWYDVTAPSSPTGDITAKAVTVTGLTVDTKVYDATTNATISGGTLVGVLTTDSGKVGFKLADTGNAFVDKNAGTNKPVNLGAITLTGDAAGNYTLTQPTGLKGAITPKQITPIIEAISDQPYTGDVIHPTLTVKDGATILTHGIDYSTMYRDEINVGTASVTVTLKDNYSGEAGTTFDIVQADAPAPKAGVMQVTNNRAFTYSFDLAQLLTDGLNFGSPITYTVSGSSTYYDALTASNVVNGKLSLPVKVVNTTTEGVAGTITVTVSSQNYKDMTATITVNAINKTVPGVITQGSYAYTYGQALSDNPLRGTVTDGNGTVAGTLNWTTPDNVPAAGTTRASWTFTPANTTVYAGVTGTQTITVAKATPTGTPAYTAISASGKTLADAHLTVGTITPGGSIMWLDGDTTVVEQGKSYQWGFEATDNNNYNLLLGSIILWPAASGGGDSGGSSGGSGGSDGGTTVVTPPATEAQPNPPATAETTVPATVDKNGNATVTVPEKSVTDAIKAAQNAAEKAGTTENGIAVVIDATSGKDAASIAATLPAAAIDALVKAGVTEVQIKSEAATITLDLATLKAAQAVAGGSVTVSAQPISADTLSDEARAAIGGRPVFELTMQSGGKAVTGFGDGTVSVALPYTPAAGENTANLYGVYVDDNGKVTFLEGSVYDPATKTVRFGTGHFSTFGIGYRESEFTDISGHWAEKDIRFTVERGLFSGTSATTFSPNTGMTRGMFVTVLGRMAGADVSGYSASSFPDVAANAYYMGYVEWAAKSGIVKGGTDGKFAPDAPITREQMAVIMANYAKTTGFTLPQVNAEAAFADSADISAYAADAVKQMQMAGVLTGKGDNRYDPQGTATRAEVATVLRRFLELMEAANH